MKPVSINGDFLELCKAIPDDSPILFGAKLGEFRFMDGIMYVPQSKWLDLLCMVAEKTLGPGEGQKLRTSVGG